MKYLKKFESQDDLEEELLEYFIDMDKNYGGRWDVSVECLPPTRVDFYRIKINSKPNANIDFWEFLVEFSARVKMAISMGNFKLHYHDYGPTSEIPAEIGIYELEAVKIYTTHFFRIAMTKETYDDIDKISEKIKVAIDTKKLDYSVIKFNGLIIFFSQV